MTVMCSADREIDHDVSPLEVELVGSTAGAPGVGERATLAAEIHDLYDGQGDGDRLLAAFRAAALYVPLAGDESMCSAEADGVQWLYAFTSAAELERFARARAEGRWRPGVGGRPYPLLDRARFPASGCRRTGRRHADPSPHRRSGRRGLRSAAPHASALRDRAGSGSGRSP